MFNHGNPCLSEMPLIVMILAAMKTDHHIDADLFDLFLSSGVYLRYAEKFLASEQIDHVDIENHLS